MTHEILTDALRALNEALEVNGITPVALSSGVAAHIGYHIARVLKAAEPPKPTGRPKMIVHRQELIRQGPVTHWKGEPLTEFMGSTSNAWQILGVDVRGSLWGRVLNLHQRFIGKAVMFDKRVKPRAITEERYTKYFVKLLADIKAEDADDLRSELNLTKDF